MNSEFHISDNEIVVMFIRAQGAGGQNVNKVSSAAHLRFDVHKSSLPAHIKERLMALRDRRITAEGIIVIKAQRYRSQDLNRQDAILRLHALVNGVTVKTSIRHPTRPTAGAKKKRLETKAQRSRIKVMRGKVNELS